MLLKPLGSKGLAIWLWVGLISYLALFWHLGSIGLVDETEPIFAETSRQMWVTGDWITPVFNGIERFDKPPLIYWLQAWAYSLLGLNEWAVRMPSALAATVQVMGGTLTLWRFGGSSVRVQWRDPQRLWAAGLGGTLLATTPLTMIWGRTGVSDMVLVACISSAMWAFFWAYAGSSAWERRLGYLGFYLGLGLGTLAKGPVAVVLPGLSVGLFLLGQGWDQALKGVRQMPWVPGSVLVMAITVPWYVAVIERHGWAYVQDFFGYHNLARFTQVVNNHAAPWYFYTLVILVGFFPYSVWLPLAIGRLKPWRRDDWPRIPPSRQLGLFSICWLVAVFGFFSVAVTKLPSYLLPLMPAAAVIVALEWSGQMVTPQKGRIPASDWITGLAQAGLFGLVALLGWRLPDWLGPDDAAPQLADLITTSGIPLGCLGGWGLAGLGVSWVLAKHWIRWLWLPTVLGSVVLVGILFSSAIFVLNDARQVPLKQLALNLQAQIGDQTPIVMVGMFKPSLVFYSQHTVLPIPDPAQLPEILQGIQLSTLGGGVWVVGLQQDLELAQVDQAGIQRFDPYGLAWVE